MTDKKQKLTRTGDVKHPADSLPIGPKPGEFLVTQLAGPEEYSRQPLADSRFVIIPVNLTEERAIAKYAEACGETVADVMRKSIIREATLADIVPSESLEYEYRMKLPPGLSAKQERKLMESKYNQIRKILGWRSVRL